MTTTTAEANSATIPSSCDYLVIGGGATAMAFADTLLKHHPSNAEDKKSLVVVMVDKHASPGGQWNDSYAFVRLHQPSSTYGVESLKLEPENDKGAHLATRQEILDYYQDVKKQLESEYSFTYVGGVTFDVSQMDPTDNTASKRSADGEPVKVTEKSYTLTIDSSKVCEIT